MQDLDFKEGELIILTDCHEIHDILLAIKPFHMGEQAKIFIATIRDTNTLDNDSFAFVKWLVANGFASYSPQRIVHLGFGGVFDEDFLR